MEKVTIKIPRSLYSKIQHIVEDSSFSSPTEFIVYVLRDLVSDQLAKDKQNPEAEELTGEEIALIKKRLRSLGYM